MQVTLAQRSTHLSMPIATAVQRHDERTAIIARVTCDGVVGYGTVTPQPEGVNGDPGYDEVVEELTQRLLPQLIREGRREGAPIHWSRVPRFRSTSSASAFAVTLMEMAHLDWHLRQDDDAFGDLWPSHAEVPVMTTVSSLDDTVWSVDGAEQVRVKVSPDPLSEAAIGLIGKVARPVLLDYNCSGPSLAQVTNHLRQLDGVVPIVAVEQPYAPGNLIDHAVLATHLSAPLSLDEGVRSIRDLDQIARYEAASMVCLKPARLGGLSTTRHAAHHAISLGLTPYIGGFFEDELGRRVNAALARTTVTAASDIGDVHHNEPSVWLPVAGGFGLQPESFVFDEEHVIAHIDTEV
jgi:O-succinylbenzoate synthase